MNQVEPGVQYNYVYDEDEYMIQEEEWDRDLLLDPAWEKQQRKVSGRAVSPRVSPACVPHLPVPLPSGAGCEDEQEESCRPGSSQPGPGLERGARPRTGMKPGVMCDMRVQHEQC